MWVFFTNTLYLQLVDIINRCDYGVNKPLCREKATLWFANSVSMAFRIQFSLTISEFAIQHFANKQKRRETYSQAVGSLLFLQSSVKNNIPHLVKHPHQRGACHSFGKHRQKQCNQNEGLPNDFYR